MKLSGVGEKVADCICLFALHHMDAFPIDTHIRQVCWQPEKKNCLQSSAFLMNWQRF